MTSACTHNCNQGRACSCAPVVIKTRPSLLARLRRWWKLRPLREALAGLDDEYAEVLEELELAEADRFLPGDNTARLLCASQAQLLRLELLDITQRRTELLVRIQAAEVAA